MNHPFLNPLNLDQDMNDDTLPQADMTHERAEYEQAKAELNANLVRIGDSINQMVSTAAQIGVLITVETEPVEPLSMGHYRLGISARATHPMRKHLEALEAAAIASEAPKEQGDADA